MQKRRCLTLIGPRQSGKTTFCRGVFPDYSYHSFESPDTRELFQYDPKGFLKHISGNAIFDEVQKAPELLSYLQEILDDPDDTRRFILTGSNNLRISSKVSQTLAGRTKILELLPFQRCEIPEELRVKNLDDALLYGSYPRIYNEQLEPGDWLGDYLQTYVEKDIRDTINIMNLRSFDSFLRLLAGRVGQVMSYNSLAGDAGISQPTAKQWISALESTYICFILQPHFKNFNKRITKSPKVYFHDTGLLCYLLRIRNREQLRIHPLRGAIFENWIISEMQKEFFNRGIEAPLYYWRDQHGHEIDLVIDKGLRLDFFEIKSSMTFKKDFMKNIEWINSLQGTKEGTCLYGGDDDLDLGRIKIISWRNLTNTPDTP